MRRKTTRSALRALKQALPPRARTPSPPFPPHLPLRLMKLSFPRVQATTLFPMPRSLRILSRPILLPLSLDPQTSHRHGSHSVRARPLSMDSPLPLPACSYLRFKYINPRVLHLSLVAFRPPLVIAIPKHHLHSPSDGHGHPPSHPATPEHPHQRPFIPSIGLHPHELHPHPLHSTESNASSTDKHPPQSEGDGHGGKVILHLPCFFFCCADHKQQTPPTTQDKIPTLFFCLTTS